MLTDDDARTLLIRKTRRDLLATLKKFYPASADFRSLRLVHPTVELQHLKGDVSYLIDKKYVEWVNKQPSASWATREYRLTAAGVEIADRIIKDPALDP